MTGSSAVKIDTVVCPEIVALREHVISVANCPSRLLLDEIADKWSVLILAALKRQPMRFNAIKRSLEGISQKVLTQTLRRLERNGIVARRVAQAPLSVEYSITPLGHSLDEPFRALYVWTLENLSDVERARKTFDAGATR
jgi:DNA-binding HxlR family transcriptional regulator